MRTLQELLCCGRSFPCLKSRCPTSMRVSLKEQMWSWDSIRTNRRKTHRCSHLCELAGICKVSNISHSVESTFVDRLDRFQYTKVCTLLKRRINYSHWNQYTQEARRLPCEVPIEPDEIEHSGQHMHSTDPTIVHFCETRCQHCGYYCDLPLSM
jgi:hypothetical protein